MKVFATVGPKGSALTSNDGGSSSSSSQNGQQPSTQGPGSSVQKQPDVTQMVQLPWSSSREAMLKEGAVTFLLEGQLSFVLDVLEGGRQVPGQAGPQADGRQAAEPCRVSAQHGQAAPVSHHRRATAPENHSQW